MENKTKNIGYIIIMTFGGKGVKMAVGQGSTLETIIYLSHVYMEWFGIRA
jgi:hypothetical protein